LTTTELTWRMWHGRETLELGWPDDWHIDERPMADAPALSDEAVAEALARPVGTARLAKLAHRRSTCCVLVDDMTRPTPAARILPALLGELQDAGLAAENIFFIVANGAHRALTRRDLLKKLGADIVDRHVVLRHDCHQNLVRVADIDGVGAIEVNRFFYEADLKIGITGLMPHFMSGFSGGSKIVMPAVCGIETIAATHEHTVGGPPAAVGVAEGNRMRRVMDRCAEAAGLDFQVNCVFNARGDLAGLFCGGPGSHEAAVRRAREVYATRVPRASDVGVFDVGVFNAFPKDTEFIQAMAALNPWADRQNPERDIVRPGGTIVVVCAATEGLGAHELIEHGRRHFRPRPQHGSFRRILGGRRLLFLAPGVNPAIVRRYYLDHAEHFAEWAPMRRRLRELHPDGARVAVLPSAPLQVDTEFVTEALRRAEDMV
jgi:nickel-dependent lactate racemase